MAQIILKVLVVGIMRNFNISANPSETNERTMDIRDAFVSTEFSVSPKDHVIDLLGLGYLPCRHAL